MCEAKVPFFNRIVTGTGESSERLTCWLSGLGRLLQTIESSVRVTFSGENGNTVQVDVNFGSGEMDRCPFCCDSTD